MADYTVDLDNFLNKDTLSSEQINNINADSKIADGSLSTTKIKNLSVDTLDVSTSGFIRSGKNSFSDTTRPGWYLSSEGAFFGNAGNTKYIKYNVSDGTFVMGGITLSWSDVSGTGKPANNATVGANWNTNLSNIPQSATASYITSTKITATTIESPSISAGTITGATIRTNDSSTPYVKMDSSGIYMHGETSLQFFNYSYEPSGWAGIDSNGDFIIGSFNYTNLPNIIISAHNDIVLNPGGEIMIGSDILPDTNSSYNLGSSGLRFYDIYANQIYCGTKYFYSYELSGITRLYSSSDFVASGSLHCSGNIYTGGVNSASGSLNAAQLYLAPTSVSPSSAGQIRNYAGGGIDQFRGIPGDGTWSGKFDMSTY